MSLPPPLTSAHFSDLDDSPSAEVAPLIQRAVLEADAKTLESLTDLLLDRALRLLREGSRQEILDEALAVSQGVSGKAGHALHERSQETFGAWSALADLLGEAARRSDRAAVPSLLRSTQGHGLAILELLAGEGRAVLRAEIRRRLNLAEAHLSHLLRDLQEADLIIRYRPEGGKEVLVELGPVGREVVSQSVLPPWLERLIQSLETIAADAPVDAEALARDLHEAGAPSRLAAERLAEAVAALTRAGSLSFAKARRFAERMEEKEGSEFHAKWITGPSAERAPRGLFGFEEEQRQEAA